MNLTLVYIWMQVGAIALGLLILGLLAAVAVLRRDFDPLLRRPFFFLIETAVVVALAAGAVVTFALMRGKEWSDAFRWGYMSAAGFAAFHLLLQWSGFYTFLLSTA
jgi:hypothetical protein